MSLISFQTNFSMENHMKRHLQCLCKCQVWHPKLVKFVNLWNGTQTTEHRPHVKNKMMPKKSNVAPKWQNFYSFFQYWQDPLHVCIYFPKTGSWSGYAEIYYSHKSMLLCNVQNGEHERKTVNLFQIITIKKTIINCLII